MHQAPGAPAERGQLSLQLSLQRGLSAPQRCILQHMCRPLYVAFLFLLLLLFLCLSLSLSPPVLFFFVHLSCHPAAGACCVTSRAAVSRDKSIISQPRLAHLPPSQGPHYMESIAVPSSRARGSSWRVGARIVSLCRSAHQGVQRRPSLPQTQITIREGEGGREREREERERERKEAEKALPVPRSRLLRRSSPHRHVRLACWRASPVDERKSPRKIMDAHIACAYQRCSP